MVLAAVVIGVAVFSILFAQVWFSSTPTPTVTWTPHPTETPPTPTTPTLTPLTTTPTPKVEAKTVGFPYSWEESKVRVTVLEFKFFGEKVLERVEVRLGTSPPKERHAREGYQFYGVLVKFRNLTAEGWECYPPAGPFVGCLFELVTDKASLYKCTVRALTLNPQQEKEKWGYFEVKTDEKPVELRCLKVLNPEAPAVEWKLAPVYIWKLG